VTAPDTPPTPSHQPSDGEGTAVHAPAAPPSHFHTGRPHLTLPRGAQLVAVVFLVMAAGLVPWTIYLGFSLPPKYHAGHWALLWTGFDVALICVLAYASWAAWFQRQIIATTALVAGVLLLCDAWFDIVTSYGHGDEWMTLLTGFGGEIPLGLLFLWLYRRIVLATLAAYHARIGDGPAPRRLRDAHVMFLDSRSAETPQTGSGASTGGTDQADASGRPAPDR
jgi:hypothetical protein